MSPVTAAASQQQSPLLNTRASRAASTPQPSRNARFASQLQTQRQPTARGATSPGAAPRTATATRAQRVPTPVAPAPTPSPNPTGGTPPTTPVRGDFDGNGHVDAQDATALFDYLFRGGPAPQSLQQMDANGDGKVDISDVVRILQVTSQPVRLQPT